MSAAETTLRMVLEASVEGAQAALGELADSTDTAGDHVQNMGEKIKRTSEESGRRLDHVAEGTDQLATKSGTLTGAFGALAGSASLVGLGAYSGQLQTAAMATDLVSGASDIATLAMEHLRLGQIASKVASLAQAAATWVANAATTAWAGAQWLLNAALSANPIGLVVIGIAALVAIIIVAWKHSETFRAIVTAAFRAVLAAGQAVWGWIKAAWPLLLGILTAPFRAAQTALSTVWTGIKTAAGAAKDWLVTKFNSLIDFFTGLPTKVASKVKGLFDGFKDAFRGAINWIIGAWNGLRFSVNIPSIHIPGTNKNIGGGSFGFGVPQIPMLARGGDIVRAGSVIVGDAGMEQVDLPVGARVTPLRNGGRGIPDAEPTTVTVRLLLDGRDVAGSLETISNTGRPLRLKLA